MATTDEEWVVDGIGLNGLAWNIATLTGREGLPPKKGENSDIPYMAGEQWRLKQWGPKTLTLAMWVIGGDEEGEVPPDQIEQFNENWKTLRKVFGVRHRLLHVTRKVRMSTGLLELETDVEVVGTLEPSWTGRTRATFTVDLLMPTPYWFGEEEELSSPGPVVNQGDTVAEIMEIDLPAGSTLTNTSFTGVSVTNAGLVSVTLDTQEFTCSPANAIKDISHTGGKPWFQLLPGENILSGSAEIRLRPPYL